MATGWIGIDSSHYDSHCGDNGGDNTIENALDGTDYWRHMVTEPDRIHWVILDLGQSYYVTKVRGRSDAPDDPKRVNIYVSNSKTNWGTAVKTNIMDWIDRTTWAETRITKKIGRYVKIEITETTDPNDFLDFGGIPPFKILDVCVIPIGILSRTGQHFSSHQEN